MQEIEALDSEIKRLKEVKALHKEYRRFACMPVGVMSKPCYCCRGWSKKKHFCSHSFCEKPCKKNEQEQTQLLASTSTNGNVVKETSFPTLVTAAKEAPKQTKQSLIQQQIRNVYIETM